MKMIIDKDNQKEQAFRRDSGQAITAMLLFMSGLMLSATAIAGLLILYQIRQAVDAGSSAQSVFAADAGVEATLRCFYYVLQIGVNNASICGLSGTMETGGAYSTKLFFRKGDGNFTDGLWTPDVVGFRIVSEGTSGKTVRILQTDFDVR